eukprot:3941052-Rhodomonas_salina.1
MYVGRAPPPSLCAPGGSRGAVLRQMQGSVRSGWTPRPDLGHEDLLAIWKELCVCAGVPATILPSKLPSPVLTGDDRHTDIKWDWPTLRGVAIVGDKSALHPFVGKGKFTQWGTYRPQKLQDSINCKNRTYAAFHREQNMQFVPLVGTTLGRLGADAVAMSWGLAHWAAEKAFLARGLNTVSPTT